jgi:hypothetical protein
MRSPARTTGTLITRRRPATDLVMERSRSPFERRHSCGRITQIARTITRPGPRGISTGRISTETPRTDGRAASDPIGGYDHASDFREWARRPRNAVNGGGRVYLAPEAHWRSWPQVVSRRSTRSSSAAGWGEGVRDRPTGSRGQPRRPRPGRVKPPWFVADSAHRVHFVKALVRMCGPCRGPRREHLLTGRGSGGQTDPSPQPDGPS